MRFILGFALTSAFAAVLTSAMLAMLQPEIKQSHDALAYLADHWPGK